MNLLASRALTWWTMAAPPGDPLGPVDQDADKVRDEACRVVSASSSTCKPKVIPTPTPSGSGDGGGIDLSIFSLLLWVLLIVAVIGLLVLLARWAGFRVGARRHTATVDEADDVEDVIEERVVVVDRAREPSAWRAEADEHRRAGRYREALRCRYRALVGDLARRGLIDEIPGRTTGEHRQQLHEVRPGAAAAFDAAAELFDGAWYGHLDVDADDDDRFTALEREVAAATEGRR